MMLLNGFTKSCQNFPAKTAVIMEDRHYSYAQMNSASDQIALYLQDKGVKPGDAVGILLQKSPEALAAFLGAMKAGAVYVPFDFRDPDERISAIMTGCAIKTVITGDRLKRDFMESVVTVNDIDTIKDAECSFTPYQAKAEDVVYILHSSGSTGVPKGIRIMHKNICCFVDWASKILKVTSSDVLGNHAPFFFDISTLDIYCAFNAGAAVVIAPETDMQSGRRLINSIITNNVTIWYSVPSILTKMVEDELWEQTSSLRTIIFAGEPYPVNKIEDLLGTKQHSCELYNFYGPTETNVCTYYKVPNPYKPTRPFPIGITIDPSVELHIRDSELVVKGSCVMKGYVGAPDIEHETYSTGDIVSYDEDNNLIIHGRKDSQVKVRGYRVEIGEIETAILKWDKIAQTAVIVEKEDGLDYLRVHAKLSDIDDPVSLIKLKTYCSKNLPVYMIPHYLTIWDELPLNKNGKIDRVFLRSKQWKQ